MSEFNNFTDLMQHSQDFGPIAELMNQIMALPDDSLTDAVVESLQGMINGAITSNVRQKAVEDTLRLFSAQNFTKDYVVELVRINREELEEYVNELQPSEAKRKLLSNIVTFMCEIFDEAANRYHSYSFELPVKVGPNGHVPTYAHNTDAAADIYAAIDITLAPHSLSNVISTELQIALPEGWTAYILPRSSMGMKTGLRLSNSVGVIDAGYRGEIGVMYDNHSDSEYVIHKGDRIAQMIIMPTYQFKPQPVDILDTTDRGAGGFGSTGK